MAKARFLKNALNSIRRTCFVAFIVKSKHQNPLTPTRSIFLPTHKVLYEFKFQRLLTSVLKSMKMTEGAETGDKKNILKPPVKVKGMTKLDRSLFDETVTIKALVVKKQRLPVMLKCLKRYKLKQKNVKPVVELDKLHPKSKTHRLLLLDPNFVSSWEDMPETVREQLEGEDLNLSDMEEYNLRLSYENWNFQEVMSAVLPDTVDGLSGFSEIGHIAHFNLREEALPFRFLIGEVLLDKINMLRTVVNKLNSIDNTYRTFEMELLAGEDNFVTQTKENGYIYELDFSKVYWNSRLGNEHHLLTKDLQPTDIVFDVFAGVGPFAVPACKHRAVVFANDLNPFSYQALLNNIQINKCKGHIKCFNLDGREFIQSCVKEQFSKIYAPGLETFENISVDKITNTLVIMNLPAMATTFLDAFRSLLCHMGNLSDTAPLPTVHCYCFTNFQEAVSTWNGDIELEIKQRVIKTVGGLSEKDIGVRFVRNVSPQKDMMRITFQLTEEILTGRYKDVSCEKTFKSTTVERVSNESICKEGEPAVKRVRLEEAAVDRT